MVRQAERRNCQHRRLNIYGYFLILAHHLQDFIVSMLRIKRLMMIRVIIVIYSTLYKQNTRYRRIVANSAASNESILLISVMKRQNNIII